MLMLTAEMIEEIQRAVSDVAASGFGEVRIVIEKSRPVRIKRQVDQWLCRAKRPPPRRTHETT